MSELAKQSCPDCRKPLPECWCGSELDERYVGYDDEDDDGGFCFHCGGDGWVECDDPIQCCKAHQTITGRRGQFWQLCRCDSCGGSGLAEDMTIW